MERKRILLLSASAGAGHVRAAEAIRAFAAQRGDAVEVIHLDALAFMSPRLRKVYADYYITLVQRAPALWSQLYRITNEAQPDAWGGRMRRWIERHGSTRLLREVEALAPDLIICTHFLPAEILGQRRAAGALACPVWVQVTDYDLHRMWVHMGLSGYFATNEEVAYRMRDAGLPAAAVHVTGLPVMPAFGQPQDRAACAAALGLDPQRPTLLLMGGGAGLGGLSLAARCLLEMPGDCQVIAMAGRNAVELAALQALARRHPGRLAPQGYTEHVERLMACADLAISKPGGATSAECLAMGLPMIALSPIPGQEERNANFLLEHGAALQAFDLPMLAYRVKALLADPARLHTMRQQARALGRPDAGALVLDIVLGQQEAAPCRTIN